MRRGGTLLLLALLCAAPPAAADGGTLRARREVGPFTLSVLTSPSPLRAGMLEVSVLVQDRATGEPRPDLPVQLAWWPSGRPELVRSVQAAPGHGASRLLAGARMRLPAAGGWAVEARAPQATLRLDLAVGPPLPPLWTQWKALLIPPLGAALLALHEWLRRQRAVRALARPASSTP